MSNHLGIIQSRGIGDCVIALPIAQFYIDQGYEVSWPICREFISHFKDTAPQINWLPVNTDTAGKFFYDEPMRLLVEAGATSVICLYQALSGHPELAERPEFQITGFDQLKYHAADVPFLNKWRLAECITRNPEREAALKALVVKDDTVPYVVIHKNGSDHEAKIDYNWIPEGYAVVEITEQTDCVFDWLSTLEGAEAIIAVDSVFANMIDQMKITETVDCYFIPRSHIHLSPILGGAWTVLKPDAETLKKISVFKIG